uniref:Uncharacterized protein n=1 Tax=Arundo donax TaxID=35708 RepID=A0A0A8ZVI5_ARUDO
MLPDQTRSSLS